MLSSLLEFLRSSGVVPVLLILVGLGLVFAVSDNNSPVETVEAPGANQTVSRKDDIEIEHSGRVGAATVSVKARPGDSQTVLARRTLQDYLEGTKQKLTPARLIYVETKMVDRAGRNDCLMVGDSVSFDLKQVERFVKESKELTQSDLQAWDSYAQTVVFS